MSRFLLRSTEIDDLFLAKLPSNAGEELAEVLMSRYEKSSTVLTSNRPVDDWPRLLGDVVARRSLARSPDAPGQSAEDRGKELAPQRSRRAGCKAHVRRVIIPPSCRC